MPTDGEIQFINLQIADAKFLPKHLALPRLFRSLALPCCFLTSILSETGMYNIAADIPCNDYNGIHRNHNGMVS